MKLKSKAVKKTLFVCNGGPLSGKSISLTSFGTLPIVMKTPYPFGGMKTWKGRYGSDMKWIPE